MCGGGRSCLGLWCLCLPGVSRLVCLLLGGVLCLVWLCCFGCVGWLFLCCCLVLVFGRSCRCRRGWRCVVRGRRRVLRVVCRRRVRFALAGVVRVVGVGGGRGLGGVGCCRGRVVVGWLARVCLLCCRRGGDCRVWLCCFVVCLSLGGVLCLFGCRLVRLFGFAGRRFLGSVLLSAVVAVLLLFGCRGCACRCLPRRFVLVVFACRARCSGRCLRRLLGLVGLSLLCLGGLALRCPVGRWCACRRAGGRCRRGLLVLVRVLVSLPGSLLGAGVLPVGLLLGCVRRCLACRLLFAGLLRWLAGAVACSCRSGVLVRWLLGVGWCLLLGLAGFAGGRFRLVRRALVVVFSCSRGDCRCCPLASVLVAGAFLFLGGVSCLFVVLFGCLVVVWCLCSRGRVVSLLPWLFRGWRCRVAWVVAPCLPGRGLGLVGCCLLRRRSLVLLFRCLSFRGGDCPRRSRSWRCIVLLSSVVRARRRVLARRWAQLPDPRLCWSRAAAAAAVRRSHGRHRAVFIGPGWVVVTRRCDLLRWSQEVHNA